MKNIYSQAGHPSGYIGRVLGRIMAWHNQADNEWTLALLGISSAENILEIGYGPGKAIQKAYMACPKCKIVGVDHSEEMLASASRLNREAIAAGTVDLKVGNVESLDFSDSTFDKAFSINCIYFWPEPSQERHIRNMVKRT